ncbi:MAG: hypothetical protein NZL85_01005 [Fimbriimonadales bacterium]|nr:hypothetical protein [Fimbriimonadales bacterium]
MTIQRRKGCFFAILVMVLGTAAFAQQNVSITLSLINPAVPEYEMQVVNNNTSGWAVDQLHVLYSTAGVLQATSAPGGWAVFPDVPWDAIPNALRFQANTASDRIAPGGSRTFRFKMNTKTPVEDLYIQFRVVQGTQSLEYVKRVKILQSLNVPADSKQTQQTGVPTPGGGAQQLLHLRFRAAFPIPTLQYDLTTIDSAGVQRDRAQYPPAPMPQPPHLEHFFLGDVDRLINAEGALPNTYWTICDESAQWNGGAIGTFGLRWERGTTPIQRPSACWQFYPSLRIADSGQRIVRFRITNCGNVAFAGTLLLYLRGDRVLPCGPELAGWPEQFPADFTTPLALSVGASQQFDLLIPADVPPNRVFYGALDMQFGRDPLTLLRFAHQESEKPLLIGLLENFGAGRPVAVQVTNPLSGFTRSFTLNADADGIWRIRLDPPTGFAFFGDAGFYLPVWQVRVKPQGALSRTFRNVLVPGGDTIDPYLRMALVLGDVDGNDCIDDADLLRVLFAFGRTGNLPEDLNRDGIVDDADLLIVLFNFGRGC